MAFGSNPFTMSALPNTWGSMPNANAGPQGWFNWAQDAGQQATVANQQLGQQYIGGMGQFFKQMEQGLRGAMGHLKGANRNNINEINEGWQQQDKQSLSSMINHGLGNSTITDTMQQGLRLKRDRAISGSRAAFADKKAQLAFNSAQALGGFGAQALGTLFQGTQIGYPDMGALAAMASQGGGGFGSGGGGGGGGPLVVGDPNRPVGGMLPAWAHYGGGSTGMEQGPGGGYYNQTQTVPSQFQQAAQGGGGGLWGPLYAGVQTAGQLAGDYQQNWADVQPEYNYGS